jgi:alpha-D-xyloside xylohydrolase
MGVDGFKTDGGEFLLDDATGADMQNGYALAYELAYKRFAGESRVLFSRAGYTGCQAAPLHWAGDQQSTWDELRHVLTAGLNAGLSGIPFWAFDIGGFAGELPSAELYLRAFAMACFSPIMQWHSEPVGGQFSDIIASQDKNNDRSPWNVAARYDMPQLVEFCRSYTEERKKLLPYLLDEARYCAATGRPLMAPLFFDAPRDAQAFSVSDQYMLGRRLMVAPVLYEGINERTVYFPDGTWQDYFTGDVIRGSVSRTVPCPLPRIPVYKKI